MSETTDDFNALKDHRKRLREKFGVPCPGCRAAFPRGNATILLPQQRCRVCHYVDERPELTDEQWASV